MLHDFAIRDLEVVLDLVDHPCEDTTLTGPFIVAVDDLIAVDADGGFSYAGDVVIQGSALSRPGGTLTAFITTDADGICPYGPLDWSAVDGS